MKQELKSGIKEFDETVEQFENGEINFVELTSRLWNKAYSIGCSEKLQQADVIKSVCDCGAEHSMEALYDNSCNYCLKQIK
jgi:hypothetical protein